MSSGLRRERDRRGLDFGYPSGEVVTGEAPGEGTRDGFVVALEGEQALFQLCGAREVVGGEHLPLHDGEVDLDLIEPAGVDRAVDRNDGGVGGLQALDTGWTAVGGPIVQDPEHPPRVAVRGDGHHLVHQTAKRLDPRVLLTAAEQLGPVDVQRREIGPGAPTLIFVLDPHPPPGLGGQTRVPPQACLDARLLVRRQHKLVLTERPALPEPGVQVEDPAGLLGKVRIPREEPTPMLPRANGVFVEPAPHGAVAKRGGQAGAPRLGSQLAGAETGERQAALARCFTGDSLDLNDYLWGGKPWVDQGAPAPPIRPGVARKSVCAICSRSPDECGDTGRSRRWTTARPHTRSSELVGRRNTATYRRPPDGGARVPPHRSTRSGRGSFLAWCTPSPGMIPGWEATRRSHIRISIYETGYLVGYPAQVDRWSRLTGVSNPIEDVEG